MLESLPGGPRVLAVGLVVAIVLAGGVAAIDLDGDGLSTYEELQAGTGFSTADSDGDGLADGREREVGTDPHQADTDGDGLADGKEVEIGSDPTVEDTDSDGIPDAKEVDIGTDPAAADTDGDGLADDRERELGTDPAAADTDSDGLDDGRELEVGADPAVADTDGDGLEDGREVELGGNVTNADTDNDGLNDSTEAELGTALDDADTDGDKLSDAIEVEATDTLVDADPLHKDVYIEMDYMRGCTVPQAQLEKIESAYANAPVENPDGEQGIDLHIIVDDEVPRVEEIHRAYTYGEMNDFTEFEHFFDRNDTGFHYALIAVDVKETRSDVGGVSFGPNMLVECSAYAEPGSIFMHEIGHSVGLGAGLAPGIDSWDVPFAQYPSVMNYNAPPDYYGYSDGGTSAADFDDWGHIEGQIYTPFPAKLLRQVADGEELPNSGQGSERVVYAPNAFRDDRVGRDGGLAAWVDRGPSSSAAASAIGGTAGTAPQPLA